MKLPFTILCTLLSFAAPAHAADAQPNPISSGPGSLTLHHPDGTAESVSRVEDLQPMLTRSAAKGDWRLVVQGAHTLRKTIHLCLQPGQRLVIAGDGPDALFDLGTLPPNEAAICLECGQFELRNFGLKKGPAWSVQISQGVGYQLLGLRISDARGGGIVVWGPCGLDQSGPAENRIEQCAIVRFNTSKAKWTHDGISVRDNHAVIARNIIRDSPTETMGIRVMGAGNRIEGNLVENVATGDAGAVYLWGGEAIYTAVGNVVRHNIIVGTSRGIYLDDGTCATRVEQNYLVDCRVAALFIGGGRDNLIDENIALRSPILAHLDNRRVGWKGLPDKAALFTAARARLARALQIPELRQRIVAGGLNVDAFEKQGETAFNAPAGNLVTRNLLMPAAQELRWQNYARWDQALTGVALDAAQPNRITAPPAGDWPSLSADKLGIANLPGVPELLKALPSK